MTTQHPETSIASISRIHQHLSVPGLKSMEHLKEGLLKQLAHLSKELEDLSPNATKKKIHELRVLSRRLRASLTLFKPLIEKKKFEPLSNKIRKLTDVLGPVRSLDVALGDLKKRASDAKGPPTPLPLLINWVRKRRKKLRKKLPHEIEGIRIPKVLQKFQDEAMSPLPQKDPQTILEKTMKKASDRVEKDWEDFHKKQKMEELHRLRVDIKKWRYLFEIKTKMSGVDGIPNFLEKVRDLQDHLGRIHDLEVLEEIASSPKFRRIARKDRAERYRKAFAQNLRNQMDQALHLFLKEGEKAIMEVIALAQGSERLSSDDGTSVSAQ
jgi:CHAD domain-containing protein